MEGEKRETLCCLCHDLARFSPSFPSIVFASLSPNELSLLLLLPSPTFVLAHWCFSSSVFFLGRALIRWKEQQWSSILFLSSPLLPDQINQKGLWGEGETTEGKSSSWKKEGKKLSPTGGPWKFKKKERYPSFLPSFLPFFLPRLIFHCRCQHLFGLGGVRTVLHYHNSSKVWLAKLPNRTAVTLNS